MSYYSRKNRERFANRIPKYERDLENKKNESYSTKLIDEDRGIKRIVQYVDDPDNSSALARVRKMSETSKSRRNSPKNSDEELENTEKNRLLFKDQKFEEEEPVRKKDHFFNRKKVHFGEKNNNNTIDSIKFKRITDMDDYKDKNNTMEPIEQVHTLNEYKPKKNRRFQRHEDTNKNDDNDNDNSRNAVSSYRAKNNRWNAYKYNNNSRTDNTNDSNINNYKNKFNTLDNDYDLKDAQVVESHHNKDKIVVNEYRTHSQDKRNLKNYKVEYVWDKNINRLVEKRIYLDEDPNKNDNNNDEDEDEYKYIKPKEYGSRYGNKFNRYEDKDKEKKYDDKFAEEPKEDEMKKYNSKNNRNYQEFKKPIRKYDDEDKAKEREKEKEKEKENEKERYKPYRRKYNQSKPVENKDEEKPKEENESKEKDSKIVEIRKRLGNCKVIFKKINKDKNKNNKLNDPDKSNDNTRFYKKPKVFPIDNSKKEEKPNYQIKNQVNTKPMNKVYKKRLFTLDKDKDDDLKPKMPKKVEGGEKKYSKRPQNALFDDPNTKVVYTKKIIDEKKPDKKEVKEILIEQNDDKDPDNFTKKNIRIQITTENLDDEGNDKIKNTAYQRYNKGKDSFDDDKFRKKDLIQSVDDINEIIYNNNDNDFRNFTNVNKYEIKPGEFDQAQDKPYYKKEVQTEEITEIGPNGEEVKTITKTEERYEEENDK